MDEYSVREIFARAAKLRAKRIGNEPEGYWANKGIKYFKRKTLGFCGTETIKTLDELSEILVDMRAFDSALEGSEFVRNICDQNIWYSGGHLVFTQARNANKRECYKIIRIPVILSE